MMNASKQHEALVKLCTAALMTAIVFAGNYLRITMPVAVGGVTAFTLANILCALSGLLLGPWWGFLSAGLGSFLYDLTNPNSCRTNGTSLWRTLATPRLMPLPFTTNGR